MRRTAVLALALVASLACAPAFAADPAPAPAPGVVPVAERASDADIDRLLKVMDAQSMMEGIMKQFSVSQQSMVQEAFGKDLSDTERERMQELRKRVLVNG